MPRRKQQSQLQAFWKNIKEELGLLFFLGIIGLAFYVVLIDVKGFGR